jgi:hypothetical protein
MGDWLGTGYIAPQKRDYRPFEKAKEFVRSLGLKSWEDWESYCKSQERPLDKPSTPDRVYKNEYKGMEDWLGYKIDLWIPRRVKELLQDLIKSRIIFTWDEAVLYSFLLRKGVLNLQSNRHAQFFKNLIEASRTNEGRKAIEEYANSDSETPPNLSELIPLSRGQDQEIESASSQELTNLIEDIDPLDYGEIRTAEQVLAQTNILESINIDEEAMQFYIDYSIDELWKSAFRGEDNVVLAVKREGKNGNKYHDTVVESFLSDYEGTQNINNEIPKGYSFPYHQTLMQLYVAYKVKTNQYFGNFSGTGASKTLSAVLASRIIDSKMTLIICPNDVVDQWARAIIEIFPYSKVTTGKNAFYQTYNENEYQYLILNYDKFSQEDSPNLILNLAKEKIDFFVLDEIHFVKKRDEESSQRRKNLDGLMTAVRKKNHNVKNLVTPQQAALEAVKWLERLEQGEISSVVRRDLEVQLSPMQIEQRIRKYGDFTRLNNQINNENSETTHNRMLKDPREWEEYHRQYREVRKTWSIIPYEENIKRIRQLSPRLQIGDFGCGEAKIMEAIGSQRVYSFDHVSINDKVMACDMRPWM